jgi:alkylhydroperoxidase family enzyme
LSKRAIWLLAPKSLTGYTVSMANSTPVPYSDASGRLRDLYDQICDYRGLDEPPNWAVYLGSTPHVLDGMWQMVRLTDEHILPPLLVQLLMFAVSRTNVAEYCSEYHGYLVLQLNNQLSFEDLLAICDGDSRGVIPEHYRVAMTVAIEQVKRRCNLPSDENQRLLDAGFSEQECLEIFGTISCAMMLNAYTMSADVPIDEGFRIPGFRI